MQFEAFYFTLESKVRLEGKIKANDCQNATNMMWFLIEYLGKLPHFLHQEGRKTYFHYKISVCYCPVTLCDIFEHDTKNSKTPFHKPCAKASWERTSYSKLPATSRTLRINSVWEQYALLWWKVAFCSKKTNFENDAPCADKLMKVYK